MSNHHDKGSRLCMSHSRSNTGYEVSAAFIKELKGYGLNTAQIFCHAADYPAVLQTYIWPDYDVAPDFPALTGFLNFWRRTLDGPLHSVQVAHAKSDSAGRVEARDGEIVSSLMAV
jgi:uncharacterized protein Usg